MKASSVAAASLLIVKVSSRDPFSNASRHVSIFVRLAGYALSSAFFSKRTRPLTASISTACSAVISGTAAIDTLPGS